jgi:hypothetical protein
VNAYVYAAACVVLPAVWGVAMHYVFGFVLRRSGARAAPPERPPPIDYEI